MSRPYASLESEGRIRRLPLTPQEQQRGIAELLAVAERELGDAALPGRSPDGRHNSAYTAARVAAEAVMMIEGYRPGHGEGQHAAVFQFLAMVDAGRFAQAAVFFGRARRVRNESQYRRAGVVPQSAADDALAAARAFVAEVRRWLSERSTPNTLI